MISRASSLKPLRIIALAASLLALFTLWLLSVVLPVTVVELRYQYRKFASGTSGGKMLGGLLTPRFSLRTGQESSAHTTDGIVIPSVFIDEPVIYNVNPNDPAAYLAALQKGIAHASGTAFPGSEGLGYFFAHSSSPAFVNRYNAVFYLLNKVALGDTVYIWHNGTKYTYEVYAKQHTAPDDVSFLHWTYPVQTVVLQTCWPPGTTSGRLLVFAKRSDL